MKLRLWGVLVISMTLLALPVRGEIILNSIDNFDTDNEGWRVGGRGVDPTFENGSSFDGNPGFLRHFSDGSGQNGKWLMWTQQPDWTGDYITAGVTGLSFWADGRTGTDTTVWVGFDGPGGWFFTPGQTINIADDWEKFNFDISPGSLIYSGTSGGTGNATDTMSDVVRTEIFAGPGPVDFASRGDLLRAGDSTNVIWIDRVAAVPEPSGLLCSGMLFTFMAFRRWRSALG